MTKDKVIWEPTCKRFVAFLDILGTKNRLGTEGHEKTLQRYKELFTQSRRLIRAIQNHPVHNLPEGNYQIFSDSIIIVSKDISKLSLIWTLLYCQTIEYFALQQGIPIKGAIACGEFTVESRNRNRDNIFFGQPLVDAVELQNEVSFCCVAIHNSVEQYLNEYSLDGTTYVVKIPIPCRYVVDRTIIARQKRTNNLEQIMNNLNSQKLLDSRAKQYVSYTNDFVHWILTGQDNRKIQELLVVPVTKIVFHRKT